MNKEQQSVLEYIKKTKEVTRGQVINEVSTENGYERINVQEAINLLLDGGFISVVGRADTLAHTNKGHLQLGSWHKRIKWGHYTVRLVTYVAVFLLGLFSNEIKNFILKLFE